MKKHLIALAVAAAVAAPAAMADTTLYGKAHISVDYLDSDVVAGNDGSNIGVSSNSSRLGVKGVEKLSSGLSAIYQYEVTVNVSNNEEVGKDDLFGNARNSFVGLTGGFGTVIAGIHDTPAKGVGRDYDLFGDQVGDSRNLIGSKTGNGVGFDLRTANVVAYVTPNMGGFSATLAYVTDHDAGILTDTYDDNNQDAYSLSAKYKAKMFDIAAAYEAHNLDRAAATPTDSESVVRVGAGVNFAGFRVQGLYQQATDAGFVVGKDQTVWGMGASYMFGKNKVKAQYFNAESYDTAKDTGAAMWAVGYDYSLSKQTTVYAAYANTSNDDAAKYTVSKGGHGDYLTPVVGGDASAFSVGVVHKF